VLCETPAWCTVTRAAKTKTTFGVLLTIHTAPELGAGSKNLQLKLVHASGTGMVSSQSVPSKRASDVYQVVLHSPEQVSE
jgi:hypothetical protein